MHERKAIMADLADGFIAMSGGMGTLEELFETITWRMLGLHQKPVGILNIDGFFDSLIYLTDHLADQGFVDPRYADILLTATDPKTLIEKLRNALISGDVSSTPSSRFLI